MRLAIIVPVLGEGPGLVPWLQALQPLRARGAQLVVVDGGGSDARASFPHDLADQLLQAPRGRAAQMNAGAWACPTADALLFLHADTGLPTDADRLIARALQTHDWGRFDVRIEGRSPWLPVVAAMMNARSRLSGIATGDQALFVRRRVFEAAGGFAALPLMEDLDLSSRLKAGSAPACLAARVTTSGRRWERHGVWRTIVLMWRLRAAWFLGADVHALARRYGYQPRAGAAVAVLAKAPVPRLAKTRLIPALRADGTTLGAAGAARAQRGFALQTLRTAAQAATGPVTLWCAPDADHRFFRALRRRFGVVCLPQPGGDIGQRMHAAMALHFGRMPRQPLLIVGTDCPVLTPAHLQQAADALQTHDTVLIPAEDGGYVLVGLRQPLPALFKEVDWSTPRVLAQTRARLQAAGATWLELPTLWDVDEPADWQRLHCETQHA